ncbi:MAG: hypothetical protein ACREDR_12390 [Blastocatellia bacterium]
MRSWLPQADVTVASATLVAAWGGIELAPYAAPCVMRVPGMAAGLAGSETLRSRVKLTPRSLIHETLFVVGVSHVACLLSIVSSDSGLRTVRTSRPTGLPRIDSTATWTSHPSVLREAHRAASSATVMVGEIKGASSIAA